MILFPKEHGQHLNVSQLRAWTKPSHRTIRSQMAKARQKIVVTLSAEGSGGQPFGSRDDRLFSEDHRPWSFTHRHCSANLARS